MEDVLTQQFKLLDHKALFGTHWQEYGAEMHRSTQTIEVTHRCGLGWVIPVCSAWDIMRVANRIFDHECVTDRR